VLATAACLAEIAPKARSELEMWAAKGSGGGERDRFTWDGDRPFPSSFRIEVAGEGRPALRPPAIELDCANSGTTMRLLTGLLASAPFSARLVGDSSLMARPMERVAAPLRAMGAGIDTTDGHAPITVKGARLRGVSYRNPVPSAQVKGAVLLAGCGAASATEFLEPAPTRDHTERALAALGGPVEIGDRSVRVSAFQHDAFEATVPGDVSSAAFLVAAAAVTGGRVEMVDLGLNPTRTRFLDVLRRMGVEIRTVVRRTELGEPIGDLMARGPAGLGPATVEPDELPLVIDEVPVLAAVAAHARGESRFAGAGELRVKESDRLSGLVTAIRELGGASAVEGDDLVVAGGGLSGGRADARGDHRMAMALAVAGLAADHDVEIEGAEAAGVSFPGFASALVAVGADVG
jgi:3-phosphoshikimate 1-carboxyvinyltransferase